MHKKHLIYKNYFTHVHNKLKLGKSSMNKIVFTWYATKSFYCINQLYSEFNYVCRIYDRLIIRVNINPQCSENICIKDLTSMMFLHSLNHDLGKRNNGFSSVLENGASTKWSQPLCQGQFHENYCCINRVFGRNKFLL